MKILFVQKVKALVGSEKYFLELIPELERRGHDTQFICIYSAPDKEKTLPFIEAYEKLGLTIHVLDIKSENSILKCLRFIRKIVEKDNFDLVHSHLIHADFWCAILKKFGKIKCPLVSTKHGYDEEYISKYGFSAKYLKPNRYFRICKFSERYIDKSFAVSEGLMHLFIDAGISKPNTIEVIQHGFDLTEIKHERNPDYRFSPYQLVVLGRIIPFKGHRYLMQALPFVKAKFPDFKLLIIGHGDEDLIAELQEFVAKNELRKNVDFLGYKSNIYDYLLNSDVMIVPSIAEGFGLIFLEAMNAKIPIVGFDVPATNEIVIDEETGLLIPPYNTGKMGEAICRLLEDRRFANDLSEKAYLRLNNHFSLDRMLNQTIDFYSRAIGLPDSSHKAE